MGIKFYDKDEKDIYFFDEINEENAFELVCILKNISCDTKKSKEEVNIFINSAGGDVEMGIFLYDFMKSEKIKNLKINTIAFGYVASAAVLLFLGGHERLMFPYSKFLLHEIKGKISGTIVAIKNKIDDMESVRRIYIEICKKELKINEQEIIKLIHNDKWIYSSNSIRYGLVDSIINRISLSKL